MSLNPPRKSEDDKWPEHWPDWVKNACDEMDAIEQRFPLTLLNGTPQWVDKMGLRIIQYMNPTTTMQYGVSGPSFLGSLAGHFTWLIQSDDGLNALIKRYLEASEKCDAELREKLSEADYQKLVERIEKYGIVEEVERMSRSLYRVILRKTKTLKKCFETVKAQSLTDQADFFEGYAQALKKPPLDETGALVLEKSTGISQIYLVMVLNWKFVSKLTSAAKCYTWLCSIFGEKIVRNEARVQTMCQAFKVKFSRRKRHQRKRKKKYKR